MVFIVNNERWCSLIEAVRRADELKYPYPIHYEIGGPGDIKYQEVLTSYMFGHLPWNGALYYEWSR